VGFVSIVFVLGEGFSIIHNQEPWAITFFTPYLVAVCLLVRINSMFTAEFSSIQPRTLPPPPSLFFNEVARDSQAFFL